MPIPSRSASLSFADEPSFCHEAVFDERSIQAVGLNGEADARTRTADPFITSEVLYQLSYVGEASEV